jgi:hypothetical protein
MNIKTLPSTVVLATLFSSHLIAAPVGTAFTYQGRLNDGLNPANGIYDLTFSIWNAASGPVQVGDTLTNAATPITNGLITITLDFGADVFDGSARWLEVGVRTNGLGIFLPLIPRQAVLATPYTVRATSALLADGLAGTLPSGQLSGTYALEVRLSNPANSFTGSGTGLEGLNASSLVSGIVPDARLSENIALLNSSPTFTGNVTAGDILAGARLRIGSGHELVGTVSTIAGGMNNTNYSLRSFIGSGSGNLIRNGFASAIVGGDGNLANNNYSFVGGGQTNAANGTYGTIGGGRKNSAADYASVAGGSYNAATGAGAFVGGGGNGGLNPSRGTNNIASGGSASVVGGLDNTASGHFSFVGGGNGNIASGEGSMVAGGGDVHGGTNNVAAGLASAVVGGLLNVNEADQAAIGGGYRNVINTNAVGSVIAGGRNNTIETNAQMASIPGGSYNFVGNSFGLAAGRNAQSLHLGAFVWADSTASAFASTTANQFSVRANGGARFVTQGAGMTVDGQPVIAGTVPSAQLNGTYTGAVVFDNSSNSFTGSGTGLGGLNASALATGTVPDARLAANVARTNQVWLLGGNAGTTAGTHFVGTTDDEPLEIKVNGQRTLRLEPNTNAPNVIGGFNGNLVGVGSYGSTIVGGGSLNNTNIILASYSTIVGGRQNHLGSNSTYSAIGGGHDNSIADNSASVIIAGGYLNDIANNSHYSALSGGYNNAIDPNSLYATIGGGGYNKLGTNAGACTIGGGYYNAIAIDSQYANIAGGRNNDIGTNSWYCAIGGGYNNSVEANAVYATIAGGGVNAIGTNADQSAIGGGYGNTIAVNVLAASIAGGRGNAIGPSSVYSTIGGGITNTVAANSPYSTIAGGGDNAIGINSWYSAIGGGAGNTAMDDAWYATIPGGRLNLVNSDAFAAGWRAEATNTGAFVWSDGTGTPTRSTNNNSVTMRASGGYRLITSTSTSGAYLAPGGGSWTSMSDRNAKADVTPINTLEILDKVAALPVSSWRYKSQNASVRHIGPMAQDFKATFGVGETDTGITTVDADGVALAAIQGLNLKVEERGKELEARSRKLEAENAELKQELAELRKMMQQLSTKHN